MISLIPDNFTTRVALPALLLTSRKVIGISIQLHSPLDQGAVTSVLLGPTTSGRKQGVAGSLACVVVLAPAQLSK
jgi:hypothetical protein